MAYITSRRFELPASVKGWEGEYHFNLWRQRQWPYLELSVGQRLFWYESPTRRLSWETEAIRVARFEYESLGDAIEQLNAAFGSLDEKQAYLADAPTSGYCLVYSSKPIRRLDRPRPDRFRMPRLGWLRVDAEVATVWGL